mmetsp:Transcript_14080/g.21703  ORF Transcript_14080/g.21703 Transcript_14080/m.21703 type:complete len:267 (-) Transcript_14080:271-1071(-)
MIALSGYKRVASIIRTSAIRRPFGSEFSNLRMKNLPLQCNVQKTSFLSLHIRQMSSYPKVRTAYPQYSVFGPTHSLTIKLIIPSYRMVKGEAVATDYSKRGRMLFEFTPRDSHGKLDYNQKARIGLEANEVGLLCNQLPHHEVEIVRNSSPQYSNSAGAEGGMFEGTVTNDMPQKVIKFSPSDRAAVNVSLDYVSGIDGNTSDLEAGPMEVPMQTGEFEVFASIMRSSLPILAGWSPLIDIAIQASINEAINGGGYDGPPGEGHFF